MQLWTLKRDVALGEPIRRHALHVAALALTDDGRSLLSNGTDGNLRQLPVLDSWADARLHLLSLKSPRARLFNHPQ